MLEQALLQAQVEEQVQVLEQTLLQALVQEQGQEELRLMVEAVACHTLHRYGQQRYRRSHMCTQSTTKAQEDT